MVWGTDDQMASGAKQLLREIRQVRGSHQVFDYLRSNGYVKGLRAQRKRIVVHAQFVKY